MARKSQMDIDERANFALQMCKESARHHKTRYRWMRADRNAYAVAEHNDWLDYCCGHMVKGVKNNALYVWRATTFPEPFIEPPAGHLCKVGTTSFWMGMSRIRDCAQKNGIDYKLIGLWRHRGSRRACLRTR